MIWTRGQLVPDEELRISVLDRSLEHGLGLFETLRTWSGHATLLSRHLERLMRSAAELGLGLDETSLPDAGAIEALCEAEGISGDAMLRITLSGGRSMAEPGEVWMRAWPAPEAFPVGWSVQFEENPRVFWPNDGDELSGYKSLNYWARLRAFQRAWGSGFDEGVLVSSEGTVREGSRTNVFVVRGGTSLNVGGSKVLSRPQVYGEDGLPIIHPRVVRGIMRGLVEERAGLLGLICMERSLSPYMIRSAGEIFLTNAVRGVIAVGRFGEQQYEAPGPATARIQADLREWLNDGGDGS